MQSPEKTSRLGTISFILAILVVVVWCIYLIIFAATTEGGLNFGMDGETAGYAVVLGGSVIMMVLTILLTLSGIVTGALALRNKDSKRGLAIAGLVLNFLCFAPYCLLLALMAFSAIPSGN